jgi:hypothetical protein
MMRKQFVVETALGRYRQRKNGVAKDGKKILSNSEIKDNSWPCILVFISNWINKQDFGSKFDLAEFIPPSVEMPDGRIVPLCVIEAKPVHGELPNRPEFGDSSGLI